MQIPSNRNKSPPNKNTNPPQTEIQIPSNRNVNFFLPRQLDTYCTLVIIFSESPPHLTVGSSVSIISLRCPEIVFLFGGLLCLEDFLFGGPFCLEDFFVWRTFHLTVGSSVSIISLRCPEIVLFSSGPDSWNWKCPKLQFSPCCATHFSLSLFK